MTRGMRMFKEHEKLVAFVLLVASILGLAFLASTFDRGLASDVVVQGKLRIIDSTIAGLLTILGMAAQALFRISMGEKLPVTIENKPNDPVPTTDIGAGPLTDSTGELRPDEKL